MKLNEAETEKLFSIDDIDTDYMMLDLADAPVSKPEAVIYFGKDGKISGLDTILMSVAVPPPVPGKKYSVTIQYTPKSYDTDVTTNILLFQAAVLHKYVYLLLKFLDGVIAVYCGGLTLEKHD